MSMSTSSSSGPDQQISERGDHGEAEASLWWTVVPTLPGEKLGLIGSFSATTAQAAAAVLERAGERLREQGCTLAVGPMDGSTWRRYRFVTEPGDEPPFFLEPTNPPSWPMWWRDAGFATLAEYYSTATGDLATRDPRLDGVQARMDALGVTMRAMDAQQFERELGLIYDVSVTAFQENYIYTPLPKPEFLAQYQAVRERLVPELVLLAEHNGGPVGYVFTTPDYAQAQRGVRPSTIIVKTLAVLPGRLYAGLGALLLGKVHESAERLGFNRAIHALMHQTNRSRNLSAHYASTIRRYALLSKRLVP